MPLIVAIEPDGRQAAQLLKLARGPLNAKLVVAESTAQALGAFDDGVPDLILTSPRLSKKDEKALADRLKTLDAAAAHVQRLTIPIFAAPGPARGKRHISRTRRSSDFLTEGCDPELFAERIAEYLELAAAERALLDAGTRVGAADVKFSVEALPAAEIVADAKPVHTAYDAKPVQAAPSIGRMMDEVLSAARPLASAHSSTAKAHVKSKTAEVPPPVARTKPADESVRRDMDLTAFIKEVLGPDAAAPITIEAISTEPAHPLQSLTIESATESAADILNAPIDPLGALLTSEPISVEEATLAEAGEATSVELGDINSLDLSTYVHQLEASEEVEPSTVPLAAESAVIETIAAEPPAAGNESAEVFEVGDFDVSLVERFGERVTVEPLDTPVEQPAMPLATESVPAEVAAPVDSAAEVFEVGEFDVSLLAAFGERVTAEVSAALNEPALAELALDEPIVAQPAVAEEVVAEEVVAEPAVAELAFAPLEQPTGVPAAEPELISVEAAVSPEVVLPESTAIVEASTDLTAALNEPALAEFSLDEPVVVAEVVVPEVVAAEVEPIIAPVVLRRSAEWAGVATPIAWPTEVPPTAIHTPELISADATASVHPSPDPIPTATVDVRRRGSLLSRLQGWLSGHRPRLRSESVARVRLSPDHVEPDAVEAALDVAAVTESLVEPTAVEFAPLAPPTAMFAALPETAPEPPSAEVQVEVPSFESEIAVEPVAVEPDVTVSIGRVDADLSSCFDEIEGAKDAAELILLEPLAQHEEVAAIDAASEILTAPLSEILTANPIEIVTAPPIEASEPTIVSAIAEVAGLVESPEEPHETEPESEIWMALPPEPPRAWPRLEGFVAAAQQIEPVALEAAALVPETDLVILEPARTLVEPTLVEAIENAEAMIGNIDAAIGNLEVAAAPPILATPTLIDAPEVVVGEPWAIDSAIEDTDFWMATPLVLQTWPRLDWFVLDKAQIVSPNGELIAASVTIAELEVSTETVRPASRKDKKKTKTKPRKTDRPVQDEWGMFDPEQCGIAAVLAKLDVDDTTDAAVRRPRNRRA